MSGELVSLDISDIASKWFKFLEEETGLDGFDKEIAVSLYNKDYTVFEMFHGDVFRCGGIGDEYAMDHDYFYDSIFELIDELLVQPVRDRLSDLGFGNNVLMYSQQIIDDGISPIVIGVFK